MSDQKVWPGTVMHRRRVIAESDNNSTDCDKELLPNNTTTESTTFCNNCCSCKMPPKLRSKSKSRSLLRSRSETKVDTYASYKEQLEMKVLGDGLTEQLGTDAHEATRKQVEEIIEILRTLSTYVHCVDMKNKVSSRLHDRVAALVKTKEGGDLQPQRIKGEELSVKLCEVSQMTSEGSNLPDEVTDYMDDYLEKHRDFVKASTNFSHILQNSGSISTTQLRKLEIQFDDIQTSYLDSKSCVDVQLTTLKNSRLSTLTKCLKHLGPLLSQISEQDKQVSLLLNEANFEFLNVKTPQQPEKTKTRSLEKICSSTHIEEEGGENSGQLVCTCSQKSAR